MPNPIVMSLLMGLLDYLRGNKKYKSIWKLGLALCVVLTLGIEGWQIVLYVLSILVGYSIGYGSPWGQQLDGRDSGVDNDSNLPDYEKWQIGPLKKSRKLSLFVRGTFTGLICLDWRVALSFGIAFLSPTLTNSWPKAEFLRGLIALSILYLLR